MKKGRETWSHGLEEILGIKKTVGLSGDGPTVFSENRYAIVAGSPPDERWATTNYPMNEKRSFWFRNS